MCNTLSRRLSYLFFLLTFCCMPLWVSADTASIMNGEVINPPASFENAERVIDADQPVNDKKIQTRVQGILSTADKYTDLNVESRQGLVFISGEGGFQIISATLIDEQR